MRKYEFLDERKFRFICQGLTLTPKDMEVLDQSLCTLDEFNGVPSKIVSHNEINAFGEPPSFLGPQVIINLDIYSHQNRRLSVASAIQQKEILDTAPALHVNLRSPLLDIPQRVEIPLRYVLKGLPEFKNTYMVYLHVLKMEDGTEHVYYGITKRGWKRRFNEHMYSVLRKKSSLLFHETFREGIFGRIVQLYGSDAAYLRKGEKSKKILVGNYHVICGAGLTKEHAFKTEEYLVEKYSYSLPYGLNMIPGGKGGRSHQDRLNVLSDDVPLLVDEDCKKIIKKKLEL